jgi:sucrose-6-phosphate hydrolase SacC (GH32 family)
MELVLAPSSLAGKRGLEVRAAPAHAEFTELYVDTARNRLEIDRTRSASGRDGGVQGGVFTLAEEALRMRLFLDGSMVEAYVNERKSLTSRIYPTRRDADGVALLAQAGDRIVSLKVWTMGMTEKRN